MTFALAGVMCAVPGCAQRTSNDWAQNVPTISPSEPGASAVDLDQADQGVMTHAPESALHGASG
jgi:hypothetical protein